jgi:hypothetical protein
VRAGADNVSIPFREQEIADLLVACFLMEKDADADTRMRLAALRDRLSYAFDAARLRRQAAKIEAAL